MQPDSSSFYSCTRSSMYGISLIFTIHDRDAICMRPCKLARRRCERMCCAREKQKREGRSRSGTRVTLTGVGTHACCRYTIGFAARHAHPATHAMCARARRSHTQIRTDHRAHCQVTVPHSAQVDVQGQGRGQASISIYCTRLTFYSRYCRCLFTHVLGKAHDRAG